MSTNRILTVDGELFQFHDAGSYADVFVNEERSRCWKVFRNISRDRRSQEVFNAELEAYDIAMNSEELRKFIPQIFRSRVQSIAVNDHGDEVVTNQYIQSLNYEIEFVDRPFCKLGSLPWEDTQHIREPFYSAGIRHLTDASIALDDTGSHKLIDFAVREIELFH